MWSAAHPITDPVSGTKTSGPGVRFVANLADPDETQMTLCGGQSGHPASPQYDDQVADWLADAAAPHWSPEAIERHRAATLLLVPARNAGFSLGLALGRPSCTPRGTCSSSAPATRRPPRESR